MVARKPKVKSPGGKPKPGAPKPKPGAKPGARGSPGKQQPRGKGIQPLQTRKGTFVFQTVADGLYIEHQWGQNSGHIGIGKESLAAFAEKIMQIAQNAGVIKKKATQPVKNGQAGATAGLGVSSKGKGIGKKKEKKEKKEMVVSTTEDLDADLDSYIKGRAPDPEGGVPAAEPVAEPVADVAM